MYVVCKTDEVTVPKHDAMKIYGGVTIKFHLCFTSVLNSGKLNASVSLFLRKNSPDSHWTGGWADPEQV
jgi:hypothetical protein